MPPILYGILQWTWGFIQSFIGACVALGNRGAQRHWYRGALITYWKKETGLSLGMFIFLPKSVLRGAASPGLSSPMRSREVDQSQTSQASTAVRSATAFADQANGSSIATKTTLSNHDRLLLHEYGHTFQSLMLGPFYLVTVGICSWLWCSLPAARRYRERTGRDYYDFWCERWADHIAHLDL